MHRLTQPCITPLSYLSWEYHAQSNPTWFKFISMQLDVIQTCQYV